MMPPSVEIIPHWFWRWSGAAALAVVVTCALFLLMRYLTVAGDTGAHDYSLRPLPIDFVRIEREQNLVEKERFVPSKPRVEKFQDRLMPPSPVTASGEPLLDLLAARFASSPYAPAMQKTFDATGFSFTRETAPLVRIDPVYPPNAERRGIEGWVKVAFTITEDGGVADVHVVDADPRDVFERAASHAISRWRYQPQLIDGQAILRSGVEVTVEFRLE